MNVAIIPITMPKLAALDAVIFPTKGFSIRRPHMFFVQISLLKVSKLQMLTTVKNSPISLFPTQVKQKTLFAVNTKKYAVMN